MLFQRTHGCLPPPKLGNSQLPVTSSFVRDPMPSSRLSEHLDNVVVYFYFECVCMHTHVCMHRTHKSIFMCVNVGVCIEVRGQPLVWRFTFHPVTQSLCCFSIAHTWLAGPQDSGDFPVSISNILIGVLGL